MTEVLVFALGLGGGMQKERGKRLDIAEARQAWRQLVPQGVRACMQRKQ